jgi:N4-gp56 family major capsid protein
MATLVNTLDRTAGGDVNNVTNEQQIYYVLTLIKRLLPYLPLWEDAQKVTIPTHSGGVGSILGAAGHIQMRKFASLAVSTTALSEGVAPDGLNLSTSTVTVPLAQYGDWIKISDLLATAAIDDVMKEATDILGENAGRKLHKIIMNALTGGDVTQIVYGGSVTAVGDLTATDTMASNAIKKAVRWLRTNNVPPYPDGYYRGILHPYQAFDLMSDTLWQDVAKYNGGAGVGGGLDLIAGEIGKMHGVRFRESTEVLTDTAGSGSAATYSSFVYGPNAFGVFDFKTQAVNNIDNETGRGMSIHSIPVNTPTKDDPLGQFGLVGWKAAFAAKVIDPLRIVRIRTGATQ